ncbi:hypothetical protein NXS08_03065 [Gleimia sp. 6138-11-ORH1]|uniref:hypothetical protein n=1 Tax=Gleimia sp. 6138-11-ORH1 TaxID=2973937 RepID=UPI002166F013|nr:hypothetical protein [Gleimia sp. 6138-11-ORH1]MCS4484469.1 hypothetical protein [Gleimia sp. 6138-11-ORH1]
MTSELKLQAAPPETETDMFGGRTPHCDWGEEICLETPTHVVVFNMAEGNAEAAQLCGRHYALTLAKHVEVHTYLCERTIREHFAAVGPLSNPLKL